MEVPAHPYSEAESRRFGIVVHRFIYGEGPESAFIDRVISEQWGLAIVRVPTSNLDLVAKLLEFPWARLCDCIVEFTRDNRRAGAPSPVQTPGLEIRSLTALDKGLLDELVGEIFADYRNHYSCNPRLASFALVDAYREWAREFIEKADRRCWLASVDGVPAGIATVKTTEPTEGVLYGVRPSFRGRGLYHDLIRTTVQSFVDSGSDSSVVSTQLENRAVQVVWTKESFRPTSSWYTVHLMR